MEDKEKGENNAWKWIKRIILSLILFFAVSVILILILTARRMQQQNEELSSGASQEIKINGNVLAANDTNVGGFKSDNFNVPQISFGGEGTIFYPTNEEQKAIAINNITSQIFTDKNKKDKKLLVSWETPKQARCKIDYERAGSPNPESYQEDKYGYTHTVLLTPLDSSTTYDYTVTARDKWGNEIQSDKFAVYTGAQEISILDLIVGAFKNIFGWAVK